jgi:integrase
MTESSCITSINSTRRKYARFESRIPDENAFGIPLINYDLRHTAMEDLKAAGVPLDVFHVLCAHRSIATSLEHYNRPSPKRRREQRLPSARGYGKRLRDKAVVTRSLHGPFSR